MTLPNKDGAKVRFPPPLVFLGAIIAGVIVQRVATPLSLKVAAGIRVAAGVLILVCGTSLVISARTWFTRTGQSPIPWKPTPELILQGTYRFTRNPMYVGVLTVILGWAVLFQAAALGLYALIVGTCFHLFIVLYEERHLQQEFGDEYEAYRRRVSRWLPRLRHRPAA